MKTFVVLALFFVANSSFLRSLPEYTLSDIKFGDKACYLLSENFAASATSTGGEQETTFKATFTSGENKIEIATSAVAVEDSVVTISWTAESASTKTGVYKLTEVKDTADSSEITFKLPETNDAACVVTVTATINTTATATTTQEVIEGDETKGTFTFVVEETLEQPPVVYTAQTNGKVISNCKVETETNVVCTPTNAEMEDGKEYTIYYHNGCEEGAMTSTTAKVKFTAKDSSSFMTLGKIALFALALIF